MPIVPDTKNWTWVIEQPCLDCGFDGRTTEITAIADLVRANAAAWPELLARPDAALRPTDDQWSALEYGCHVRDVFRLYALRLGRMLTEDTPRFDNWDQDVTAVEQRYDLQDPIVVAGELVEAAEHNARLWETVTPEHYARRGVRSDGAEFTVVTFATYFIHDPIHHLDDVARGNRILADSRLD